MATAVMPSEVYGSENVLQRAQLTRDFSGSRNLVSIGLDAARSSIWITLLESGQLHVTQELLEEVLKAIRITKAISQRGFRYRILKSSLPGTFSLGGDLGLFIHCAKKRDRKLLQRYAWSAVDAIWENITGSAADGLTTISIVDGEAQGGGFEAALSSHVLIAEKGCYLGFPEGLFGLYPGMGAFELLKARANAETAREIIGSARRWSAEELYRLGVVDMLAEAGAGQHAALSIVSAGTDHETKRLRDRFEGIKKEELIANVEDWIDTALDISDKNIKAMELISTAQERARQRREAMEPQLPRL